MRHLWREYRAAWIAWKAFLAKPDPDADRPMLRTGDGEPVEGTLFYGDGGTIHGTSYVDVEVHKGRVVAVWFRCTTLPYRQADVDAARAESMAGDQPDPLAGVVFRECQPPGWTRDVRSADAP